MNILNYLKNGLVLVEFILTISLIINEIKNDMIINTLKWMWVHHEITLWIICFISIFIMIAITETKEKRKSRKARFAFNKWMHLMAVENQLFQINDSKYRENFTAEEMEMIGFDKSDILRTYPYPKELKERHEKELNKYWEQKKKDLETKTDCTHKLYKKLPSLL